MKQTALKAILTPALQQNHYHLTTLAQEQLLHYLELLQKWNRVFNLTSIDSAEDMVYRHILDSLAIYPHLQGDSLLDVGSGAGLPGLPLAIINPKQSWTLLDKSQKKTRFLLQVSAELGLKNVTIVCSRCQDFQSPTGFNSIVSRAFANIKLFLACTQHLICPQGLFLAMKGLYPEEEIRDLPDRFKIINVVKLNILGLQAERHLVKIGVRLQE